MTLKRSRGWAWPLLFLAVALAIALSSVQAQTNTNAATRTAVEAFGKNLTFGLDRVPILQRPLFSIPLYQYLASSIFLLLAFYGSKVLDFVVGHQLKKWAAKTSTKLDDILIELIHGPLKIVTFVVLVHMGLQLFPWPALIAKWLSKGLELVVAVSITYMALKFTDVLVGYWRQRARAREDRNFNEQLFPVVSKSFKVFILIVAALVTCQNLGLDITAMLASLSIGGLALGLAAQDTVANLFGAVAVFVDKPFRVGDRIKLDNIDGTVESIGLRSTRIRNLDGHLITVPNKTMGNATITNVTRRPHIKTELNIGLTYDTSAEKVKRALELLDQIFRGHPMTEDLVISFNKFADSALNINVVHWWKNTDYRAYVQGMQELNLAVKERFDQEGLEFAFPSQTLYLKSDAPALPNGSGDHRSARAQPAGAPSLG